MIGDKIRKYRKKAFPNKSMRSVADEIGVNFTHLSKIETGKYVPKPETLQKIANGFDLNDVERLDLFREAQGSEYRKLAQQVAEKEGAETFAKLYRKKDQE